MNRKTTKHRQAPRNVLQVRVMSPRIAWLGFLRLGGSLAKAACLLAALAGIAWCVWRGIQHTFYQNPDFRLQVIDLNPNPAIDELGVAAAAGIDLTKGPSLFDVDVNKTVERLKALPALTDARIERHLPGTLVVRVVPRFAKAWIACPEAGVTTRRQAGELLVDRHGFAYPCPEPQLATAATLPIIELPPSADHPIAAGAKIAHPELERCFLLLDSACAADPHAARWIESIRQTNDWSLMLVTRHGTRATFSLGDHARQIESLRAALDHAAEKGYTIETINLIPKYNVPITVRQDGAPPKAIPISMAENPPPAADHRSSDLNMLLKRN